MNTKMAIPEQPLEILRTLTALTRASPVQHTCWATTVASYLRAGALTAKENHHATEKRHVVSHYVFEAPVRIWHWLTVYAWRC